MNKLHCPIARLRRAVTMAGCAVATWIAIVPSALGAPGSIAITNVRIIDGNGGLPIEHGTIVVSGSKIVAVGAAGQVSIPAESRRIDASGKTVLPGLADMHVHLLGGSNGHGLDVLGYRRYLNALLYAGVTTVLDTGNLPPFVFQLRSEIALGHVPGPRVYCVGPILDGADPVWPAISIPVVSKDQVPRIVSSLARDQADFIKLYVGLSDPLVRLISSEAKKKNLRTIIDQWRRNGSADLAQTGIAGFAHFPFHEIDAATIETIKKNDVFFISTLAVQESSSGRRWLDMSFLDNPLIADTTPRSVLEKLRKEYGNLTAEQLAAKSGFVAEVDLQGAKKNVRRLKDAGVLFAAGTDAVYPGDFQGEGLHRELELLVESGLTPLEAITTATKNAATILKATDEWGTLAAGKTANLIVVSGMPDRRIGDTRNIEIVMKDGIVIDRAKLRIDHNPEPDYQEFGSAMEPVW